MTLAPRLFEARGRQAMQAVFPLHDSFQNVACRCKWATAKLIWERRSPSSIRKLHLFINQMMNKVDQSETLD